MPWPLPPPASHRGPRLARQPPLQLLPLVPPETNYWSPYSGLDALCGNTLMLPIDELIGMGLLDEADRPPAQPVELNCDFAAVAEWKVRLLLGAAAGRRQRRGSPSWLRLPSRDAAAHRRARPAAPCPHLQLPLLDKAAHRLLSGASFEGLREQMAAFRAENEWVEESALFR